VAAAKEIKIINIPKSQAPLDSFKTPNEAQGPDVFGAGVVDDWSSFDAQMETTEGNTTTQDADLLGISSTAFNKTSSSNFDPFASFASLF